MTKHLLMVLILTGLSLQGHAKADNDFQLVEVKVDILASDIPKAMQGLGISTASATGQNVYFYETVDLSLFQNNLILRGRQALDASSKSDFTVKVRPIIEASVTSDWFTKKKFKCDYDATSASTKAQCNLKVSVDDSSLQAVAQGQSGVWNLFSPDQVSFAQKYGMNSLPWDELQVLGPVASSDWSISVNQGADHLDAELWIVKGHQFLEISKTVALADADTTRTEILGVLQNLNVQQSSLGENKTEFVMQILQQSN